MLSAFELDNDEEDKKIKENEIIVLTHLKILNMILLGEKYTKK